MKRALATLLLIGALTGCQYGRYTTFNTDTADTPPTVAPPKGWTNPANGTGYGTWTHDPAIDNGCNEWDTEPVAEIDNDGVLCTTVLP